MINRNGTSLYTSGEMCKALLVSERTLRYYTEKGIIKPAWVDPSNGYRYYDYLAIHAIGMQRAAKELGLPMSDYGAIALGPEELSQGQFSRASQRIGGLMRRKRAQIAHLINEVDGLQRIQDEFLLIADKGVGCAAFDKEYGEQTFFSTRSSATMTRESSAVVETIDQVVDSLDYRFGRIWESRDILEGAFSRGGYAREIRQGLSPILHADRASRVGLLTIPAGTYPSFLVSPIDREDSWGHVRAYLADSPSTLLVGQECGCYQVCDENRDVVYLVRAVPNNVTLWH